MSQLEPNPHTLPKLQFRLAAPFLAVLLLVLLAAGVAFLLYSVVEMRRRAMEAMYEAMAAREDAEAARQYELQARQQAEEARLAAERALKQAQPPAIDTADSPAGKTSEPASPPSPDQPATPDP